MARLKNHKSRGLVHSRGSKSSRSALAGVSGNVFLESKSVSLHETEGSKTSNFEMVGEKVGFGFGTLKSRALKKDARAVLGEQVFPK